MSTQSPLIVVWYMKKDFNTDRGKNYLNQRDLGKPVVLSDLQVICNLQCIYDDYKCSAKDSKEVQ